MLVGPLRRELQVRAIPSEAALKVFESCAHWSRASRPIIAETGNEPHIDRQFDPTHHHDNFEHRPQARKSVANLLDACRSASVSGPQASMKKS